MDSREMELIFHKSHQKEREMLCRSLLWLTHLWWPLKMLLQALDGTAMWCFFLILSWTFFAQFFLGLSQVTCWIFTFLYFFLILFGCRQFSLTLTTMIAYCPHKASGEGGLVQIWIPSQQLDNHKPLGYLNVFNHLQASLSYIFTLPTFQFVCLDKKNMKWCLKQ